MTQTQRLAEARERVEAMASRSPGAFSRLLARLVPSELRSDLRTLLAALDRVEGERDEALTQLRDALAARNAALADATVEGARALAAEADNARLREAWDWLASDRRLSIEHHAPVYGDDDDQSEEWRVHRETGNINDREWDLLGAGATPLEAVLAARQALGAPDAG